MDDLGDQAISVLSGSYFVIHLSFQVYIQDKDVYYESNDCSCEQELVWRHLYVCIVDKLCTQSSKCF